jgi:hypothetical protein
MRSMNAGKERDELTSKLLDFAKDHGEQTGRDIIRFLCNRLNLTELKEAVEEWTGSEEDY